MGEDRSSDDMRDHTLLAAASGDEQAWAELVRLYSRRVFGLVFKNCGDRELAEEITQATFVKVVEKVSRFTGYEERGRFEPWLFRIAMNRLRDEMRRRGRQARTMDMSAASSSADEPGEWALAQQEVIHGGPAEAEDPFDAVSRQEQVELLQQAVAQMNEADRELIYLRHTAGLSFAEIAETLDQPLGTVLARGHRALRKLRKALAVLEDNAEEEVRKQAAG